MQQNVTEMMEDPEPTIIPWNVPPKNGLTAYFTKETFHKYIPEETFHTKLLKQLEGFDVLPKTQFTTVPEVKTKEKTKNEKKKGTAKLETEETLTSEEISQNEADKNESENGNKLDRLNSVIVPTTGNECKPVEAAVPGKANAKSKQKAKQNESSTAFSEILSSLPVSGRRYQSHSSQHHPTKKSCLSQQEQRFYLDLFEKYSSHIPADPTEEERAELRRFTALKSKVSHEQAEFQAYLKELAQKCVADYKFILPSAKRYIQDKIQNGKKEVEKYPRHYNTVESVALVADSTELQSVIRLNYVCPLLCLGQVPKVQLPNMSMGIHPLVATDYDKIQERFPIHHDRSDSNGTWNHESCSSDSNAEFLAVNHGCQVVMSSSALSCLVDNQDPQHDRLWELPVHIKEHESVVNGQIIKHNVIYFDKPVQQSSLNIREKSTWFHKFGLKMLVTSSVQKGQLFSNSLQPSKLQKGQTTIKEAQVQRNSKCDQGRKEAFVQQPGSEKKNKVNETEDKGKPISDLGDPFGSEAPNMEDLETFGAAAFSPRKRSTKKHDLDDSDPVAVKKEDKTDYEIRKEDKSGCDSGDLFCSEAVDIDSLETFGTMKTFSGDISKFTCQGSSKKLNAEVKREHFLQNSETVTRSSEVNEDKDSNVEFMSLKTCSIPKSVKPESKEESSSSPSSAAISPTENKFQTDANRSAFTSVHAKQGARGETEMQEGQPIKEEGKEINNDIEKEMITKDSDLNLSTEDSDEEDKLVIAYDCHEESNLESQSSSGSQRRLTRSATKPYAEVFGDQFMVDTPQSPTGDSPSSPIMATPQSPTMETPQNLLGDTPESPQKDSSITPTRGGSQREICVVIPLERQSDTETGDETMDCINSAKKRQEFSHIVHDHSDNGKDLSRTTFISDYSLRPLTRWQSSRRGLTTQLGNKDNISAMSGASNKNSNTLAGAEVTATVVGRIGRHIIAHEQFMKQDSKEGNDNAKKGEKRKSSVEPPPVSDDSEIQSSPRVLRSTSRKSDSSDSQSPLVDSVRKSTRKRMTRASMDNGQLGPDGQLNVTIDSEMEEKPAETAVELVSTKDVSPPKRKRGRPPKIKVMPVDTEKGSEESTISMSSCHVPPAITSLVIGQNKVQTATVSNSQPVVSTITSRQKVTLPAYGDNKGKPMSSHQEKKSDKTNMKKDPKQGIMKAEASNASPLDAILNMQQKMLGVPSESLHASPPAIPVDETGNIKHPRHHNVTYHLWTLGTTRVLIRCGYHGILRDPKYSQFSYVHICPKLEYQLSFGLEQSSVSEVARNWIGLYIRPNCQQLRARINPFTSEVVVLEELDIQRVIPLASTFKPAHAFLLLQRLFSVLLKCPVGQYLIVHTPGESNCKILKSTEGNKRGTYDLHFKHLGFMTDTGSRNADPVQWNPIDTSLLLPQHRRKGRIPATYTPQDFTGEKFKSKKKKKKGKRKQKKKK